MPPTKTDVERALAFHAATNAACSDLVRDLPFGRVVSTPSLPLAWSLNAVEIAPGAPEAPPEDIVAALPDVPRPSVYVEDEAAASRLTTHFVDGEGWDADHELFMVLGTPPAAPPADAVREGTREDVAALQRQWLTEDFESQGPEALAQLMRYMDRQWEARNPQAFVVPDGSAMTLLWSEGGVAQIEDVYTRPDARNRGHARALVSHAAALAARDHDVVFLVADDAGTPKELYAKLGFEPALRATRFVRGGRD